MIAGFGTDLDARLSLGATDDGRAHEGRRLRQRRVLDLRDRESGLPDGVKGRAVAVAADDEPVEPVHPVLQPGRARVLGAQVLDKQQLATGPQYPPQFSERSRLIIDPAQDERGDGYVESAVVEG